MPSFYEFFAGGGMARAGLGPGWTCSMANDVDARKAAAYRANWGGDELIVGDVAALATADLPGLADLAWASFPCQDLSLAGAGGGLAGVRSGAFHPFWRLIQGLAAEGRAPKIVALENVCGALTSHGGADFAALVSALVRTGFRPGVLIVDAALFLPQSRPRLFLIGVRGDLAVADHLVGDGPEPPFHPPNLVRAAHALPPALRSALVWWRLPAPPRRNLTLAALLEAEPGDVRWRTDAETGSLCELMSPVNRARLEAARQAEGPSVGTLYRRTRWENGRRVQRAEARFDGLAGCLRTPAGGSSRQSILVVEGGRVRSRLISAREAARLMGLPDSYALPRRYTDAYHLLGDGVAAGVVRHLARGLFEPLLASRAARQGGSLVRHHAVAGDAHGGDEGGESIGAGRRGGLLGGHSGQTAGPP